MTARIKQIPAEDKTVVLFSVKWPKKSGFVSAFRYDTLVTAEDVYDKVAAVYPEMRCVFIASVDKTLKNGDIRRTISYAFAKR